MLPPYASFIVYKFWPPGGSPTVTCTAKFEISAPIANLATKRGYFHQLQIGAQSGTTCIGSTFGHHVAPLALVQSWPPGWVTCIATLPGIALLALSVIIGLVTSSARVTSVKSAKGVSAVTDIRTHRSDPRFTWVPEPYC